MRRMYDRDAPLIIEHVLKGPFTGFQLPTIFCSGHGPQCDVGHRTLRTELLALFTFTWLAESGQARLLSSDETDVQIIDPN
jgi:hypothetical protein